MTERDDRVDEALPAERAGELESFFAAARAEVPQPGGDVLARIEAQALAAQPAARPAGAPPQPRPVRFALLLREALGGWTGIAALATACAAGIWIGVSPPDGLSAYLGRDAAALGTLGIDPLGGFDLALMEG